MKRQEVHIVEKPNYPFKPPKVKFNGKYFRKRLREIRKSMPKGRSF